MRVHIHRYDFDQIVMSRVAYGSDPDPIFNTYHTLMRLLLADPDRLAPSPDEASLFLVPAFGTNMDKLLECVRVSTRARDRSPTQRWPGQRWPGQSIDPSLAVGRMRSAQQLHAPQCDGPSVKTCAEPSSSARPTMPHAAPQVL